MPVYLLKVLFSFWKQTNFAVFSLINSRSSWLGSTFQKQVTKLLTFVQLQYVEYAGTCDKITIVSVFLWWDFRDRKNNENSSAGRDFEVEQKLPLRTYLSSTITSNWSRKHSQFTTDSMPCAWRSAPYTPQFSAHVSYVQCHTVCRSIYSACDRLFISIRLNCRNFQDLRRVVSFVTAAPKNISKDWRHTWIE